MRVEQSIGEIEDVLAGEEQVHQTAFVRLGEVLGSDHFRSEVMGPEGVRAALVYWFQALN